MVNIKMAVELLLKRISPRDILKENIRYDLVSEKQFQKIARAYATEYTEDELKNFYYALLDMTDEAKKKYFDVDIGISDFYIRSLNIFDLILLIVDKVLLTSGSEVLCRYSHLLDWRELTVKVSEDSLTTAYCAADDLRTKRKRTSFSWPVVIGHNNFYLKKLLQQELSDNHTHLWASSPHFCLSWIKMMNHTDDPDIYQQLQELNENKLHVNRMYDQKYTENPLEIQYLQAALIRLFLFTKICDCQIQLGEYELFPSRDRKALVERGIDPDCEEVLRELKQAGRKYEWSRLFQKNQTRLISDTLNSQKNLSVRIGSFLSEMEGIGPFENLAGKGNCCWEWLEDILISENPIPLHALQYILCPDYYKYLWEELTEDTVESWVKNEQELLLHKEQLQIAINSLKWKANLGKETDYIFAGVPDYEYGNGDSGAREQLRSERFFLYCMYQNAYYNAGKNQKLLNWFYAYIVIKESMRSEMIQSNERIGFKNFQNYDRRKKLFLVSANDKQRILKLAIEDTLSNRWLKNLEIRIVPRDSATEDRDDIRLIDNVIDDKRYYFVYHFVKSEDSELKRAKDSYTCRNYRKRQQVRRQAESIVELREKFPNEGKRVLGIDACSSEIGCRPEVFAQAFRYLKKHCVDDNMPYCDKEIMPQLRATYHVGEDFLDIVDGLRAIDEAVKFLNLSCGDRLGHALAMGLDVRHYYNSKHNLIYLPVQDYLDNLAWMYHQLGKSHINVNIDELRSFIETEFNTNFYELYGDCVKAYKDNYNIRTYYEAWQLRGDNPECYETGVYLEPSAIQFSYWGKKSFDGYEINDLYPRMEGKRKIQEVTHLYWAYHYAPMVYEKGKVRKEIHLPECWVEGAEYLQKIMQQKIAKKGISIECNPSSNYMIAGLGSYQEHPIVRWYNNHLEEDQKLQEECPQLSVSINTDDKGDFSTSIENEYALMACALEQEKGADGNPKYKRTKVYEWLDEVRKMGNLQSFQERKPAN
ncbi:MAG: hypothetical protein LUI87_03410 [Lachnospiraceae bacterium]|nr:hypothetical protein [Lachnospiraceae bacterium]